ncbi:hypothetical protein HZS_7596 [Henneguya salminicola]|nr:hypothetical protein HZS_7596 [Henneguya salminicola]
MFIINQRIIYKFYGYKSFANEGLLSGCCGDKLKGICMPCQYIVHINKVRFLPIIALRR